MQERLQKILAQAGICSRRAAEELIAAGRVTVGGKKAEIGDKADSVHDQICVNGKPLGRAEQKKYLMLYKPRGYVTSLHDEKGRKDVSVLMHGCHARVYPVGRLDYDSEGLLLLTNDGELAYRLTHPGHEVDKQYLVSVRGSIKRLGELSAPMEIDGYQIQPAQIETVRLEENGAVVRMTIHEGRNRQIRKMCEQCGFAVRRLKREAIGTLRLDPKLPVGKWRALTKTEIEYLSTLTVPQEEK